MHRRARRRKLILRGTTVLPALCTLLNGLCGFGAIHLASRDGFGQAQGPRLELAGWLIFLAMVCDMLDGRLARWARKTSDFGAQLDSLCDAISFGVAPGILMLQAVASGPHESWQQMSWLPDSTALERAAWCIAAIYASCAVLRLARFNVENEPDESAHMNFRGLPSPGAAATVAAMVLLYARLGDLSGTASWAAHPTVRVVVGVLLPLTTLATALLMVSRFRYAHIVNQFIRGKKSFAYLVKLLLVVVLSAGALVFSTGSHVLAFFFAGSAATLAYALSGPLGAMMQRLRHGPPPAMPAGPETPPSEQA